MKLFLKTFIASQRFLSSVARMFQSLKIKKSQDKADSSQLEGKTMESLN